MKKTLETIIFIALIASTLTSLILSLVTDISVDINFYVGFVCAFISLGTRLKSIKISNQILVVSLILGTFNLIKFSHISVGFSFSFIGIQSFGINPIPLILLFLFIVANKELIQSTTEGQNEAAKEQKIKMDESYIQDFMQKNEDKSIEELQEIINNPEKYVKQLVIAAERLVDKKRNVL